MSQTKTTKEVAAEERTEEARSFVRRVEAATRHKHTSEEKIRIVLEGQSGQVSSAPVTVLRAPRPRALRSPSSLGTTP